MKFLSVYLNKERNTPPSPAEMERMGKLVEEGFKSGKLLAVEGCMPSALGARVRQAVDLAIETGRGNVDLLLTPEQFAKLTGKL